MTSLMFAIGQWQILILFVHALLFCSLPADVLWGSFVMHSFLDKRTPKGICGEANCFVDKVELRRQYQSVSHTN